MVDLHTTQQRWSGVTNRYQMLDAQIDQAKIDAIMKAVNHIPGGIRKAMPPALNRTAQEGRTVMSREFRTRLNVKVGSIKSRLELIPKASQSKLVSGIRIALSRITLTSFKGTRQLKGSRKRQGGVKWSPSPGDQRMVPRAFIQTGKGNTRQAFRRAQETENKLVPRYPIHVLRGPSLGYVFAHNPSLQRAMTVVGGRILEKKAKQQVNRLLAKIPK